MPLEPLTAVSPADGRYRSVSEALAPYLSEYALIRYRSIVEFEYLIALSESQQTGLRAFTDEEKKWLRESASFTIEDARIVRQIEKEGWEGIPATNHDVKAVEYFLKSRMAKNSLKDVLEWTHFALTSEDVNSLAYGLALRDALEQAILPALSAIGETLAALAVSHAETPMLSRTHGQSASPTTFGKEMRVFERRLARQIAQARERSILVKFGGATGSFNAHKAVAPQADWPGFARGFVERLNGGHAIRLEHNAVATQIEPHDTYAELSDNLRRACVILTDFSQDMWRYISDGWVAQKPKEGEIGSSAMPHKVNPIDFENAEGNLGLAAALFEHFSRKLPISRLQRDLSDSTVERAFGEAFAHFLVACAALSRGLSKIQVSERAMLRALQEHPEVLAEAFQTILRAEGVAVPYEKLKGLTRGRRVTLEDFAAFADSLDVPSEVKTHLKALRPETYLGLAPQIARASSATA